jgi:hypothetical protein
MQEIKFNSSSEELTIKLCCRYIEEGYVVKKAYVRKKYVFFWKYSLFYRNDIEFCKV